MDADDVNVHECLASVANFKNQTVDSVSVHSEQTLTSANAHTFEQSTNDHHGLINVNSHVANWLGLFFYESLAAILAFETLGSVGVLAGLLELVFARMMFLRLSLAKVGLAGLVTAKPVF